MTNCESDDVIASYALTLGEEHKVIISSFDSDFFQLINDNVSILRYRGDNSVICDRKYMHRKFGIGPEMYAHFKSLTGDSADNIKGLDKIGPKTAAWLVNEYGGINEIIANADKISKPSIRRSVCDGAERLKLNYALIKLTDAAELPFCAQELEYHLGNVTTNQVLSAIGVK
jgi:DNA polymerase-1